MQKIRYLIVIIISIFGCSQNKINTNIHIEKTTIKNFENKGNSLPNEFDKTFFNRKIVYEYFNDFGNCNYDNLYKLIDNRIKKKFTKKEFIEYFNLQKFKCNNFKEYNAQQSIIKNGLAKIDFISIFENDSIDLSLVYNITNKNPKIISITTKSKRKFLNTSTDFVSNNLLDLIKNRNFEKLYDYFTEEYKKVYSKEGFISIMTKLTPFEKVVKSEMNEQEIFIEYNYFGFSVEYIIDYENNTKRKVKITLVKNNNNFKLLKVDYIY